MIDIRKQEYFNLLENLEDNSVDMIFTDPPYWTLDKWRNVGTTTRLGGNKDVDKQIGWFKTINQEELFQLMRECYRVLKKDRHFFLMCDGQTLKWVLAYYEEVGFDYAKPIVWDKVSLGMGYHFRSQHEFIVMMDKGKNRKIKNMSLTDIIRVPMVKGGYPTEKPYNLVDLFVEQFTEENELVVDPFLGGGAIALSCQNRNRNFLGCDISDESLKITREKLNNIQMELFK